MTYTTMRSPVLLLAAAQALVARPALTLHRAAAGARPRDGGSDGMRFVQHAGYWSHYDARSGLSSWPFTARLTLPQLLQLAESWGILREHGGAGDLVVRAPAGGESMRIGIVMHVERRMPLPGCDLAQCDIAREHARWGERPSAELRREWIRPQGGDRYVCWCDSPLRLAMGGRVA